MWSVDEMPMRIVSGATAAAGFAVTWVSATVSGGVVALTAVAGTDPPEWLQWVLNNGLAVAILIWLGVYFLVPIRDAAVSHFRTSEQAFPKIIEALNELRACLHRDMEALETKVDEMIERRP
jgi:low affinity Fe/Cu permease